MVATPDDGLFSIENGREIVTAVVYTALQLYDINATKSFNESLKKIKS